ncbi:hypothetical protein HanPSC8_Chr06g0264471 [Helianthus annuus]|nr:hypothetical protein HanPSC8_Chr06g0264471 [Helianthus annuus]
MLLIVFTQLLQVWKLFKLRSRKKRKIVVEARKMNSRNHFGNKLTKSFLLKRERMGLEYFIREMLKPV